MKKTALITLAVIFTVGTVYAAERVNISGTVYYNNQPLNAIVLANGQYMFTDTADGIYDFDAPPDENGEVALFVFCDGFDPFRQILELGNTTYTDINMSPVSPDSRTFNMIFSLTPVRTGWVKIKGTAAYERNPLNIMVLANGQYMFTNAEDGLFELEAPLDKDNKVILYGFCDGFAPYRIYVYSGGTKCRPEGFTEAENEKLDSMTALIPSDVAKEFNSKYTAWKDTWAELAFYSDPRKYAESEQYYDFLKFCRMNSETLAILFRMFAEDDYNYLTIIPIKDLTAERYGFIMDEVREESLSQKCYDENGKYVAPSQEGNGMKYIKRILADLTKCETEEFTEAENNKLNALIADISTETVREFNSKYTAWEDTWAALAFHSNPYMYAKSEQYYDFLEFCKMNDETLPILFRMFAEDDDYYYLVIIPIENMTIERYGFIMDEIVQESLSQICYNENGLHVNSSQKGNAMKYIKRLLELLYE
ncbi:MAG: hypothetical protein GY795_47845 [Desulfobacterales bacterium]|nr:hypothetical protein [Desulfobacterales bacterium]